MQIKGAELQLFSQEAWPQPEDDWFWDHDLFDDKPEPEKTYDTDDIGAIRYQGSGEDPTDGEGFDVAKLIRRWRKVRDKEVLTIALPKAKLEEFKVWLKSAGGLTL